MNLSIKQRAANVSVTYEYSGHPDFWGGNGRRWDSNAGCLFATYDRNTTYADLIDSLVDDFDQGGDFEDCPDWVDSEVIRQAIKNSFVGDMSDIVDSSATPKPVCRGCGAELETEHGADCPIALELCRDGGEYAEYEPDELEVVPDDCDDCDDYIELPVYICLVEIDVCPDCNGCPGEGTNDNLCDDCNYVGGEDEDEESDCNSCNSCDDCDDESSFLHVTILRDALANLDLRNNPDCQYCRGLVVGIVSGIMAVTNFPIELIFREIRDALPESFDPDMLPEAFRADIMG